MNRYPEEILDAYEDDGTMPANVAELTDAVVGHRIVNVNHYSDYHNNTIITLDNGTRVRLSGNDDCCAYTDVESFLLNHESVDHIITGVGTTDGYTTWHIYADAGDMLELTVSWSCGNPFYYGYGLTITVEEI